MQDTGLHILNVFFFAFHTALVLFNLFGWLFRKTRRLHLYSMLLLVFSWVVLGFWKGFGYCFLTDWHYQVLWALGERGLPNSYIAFLVERLSGWRPDAGLVDALTLACTVLALVGSLWVNLRKPLRARFSKP